MSILSIQLIESGFFALVINTVNIYFGHWTDDHYIVTAQTGFETAFHHCTFQVIIQHFKCTLKEALAKLLNIEGMVESDAILSCYVSAALYYNVRGEIAIKGCATYGMCLASCRKCNHVALLQSCCFSY